MARIYVGDLPTVNKQVLNEVKRLPDDFCVFAQFNVGRNVDWLIIKKLQGSERALIVTEDKEISRSLSGSTDGAWMTQNESGAWEPCASSNENDTNPYWQVVHTVNALSGWLWNNQALYRENDDILPEDRFKAWPDLLIISPPGVRHRLPIRPSTRFGRWWFSIDEWSRHLLDWKPKLSINLTDRELEALAQHFGLRPLGPEPAKAPDTELSLASRLADIEQRLAAIESRLGI